MPTGVATLNPFGSRASWKWVDSALAVAAFEGMLSAFATDPANLYAWTI